MQHPSPNNNYVLQPSFNTNYMKQPVPNPDEINDTTTTMNMALVLMAKAFKLNYSTPTNNNQRILSNPCNRQIAQPGIRMGLFVPGIANQNANKNGNGNVMAAQAEGNGNENNEEAWIQLQDEEFNLMAAAGDIEDIEEVNVMCRCETSSGYSVLNLVPSWSLVKCRHRMSESVSSYFFV
ncbi:hypothetical protein Tco_1108028 [Tanacetum coccineum]